MEKRMGAMVVAPPVEKVVNGRAVADAMLLIERALREEHNKRILAGGAPSRTGKDG